MYFGIYYTNNYRVYVRKTPGLVPYEFEKKKCAISFLVKSYIYAPDFGGTSVRRVSSHPETTTSERELTRVIIQYITR